MRTFWSSRFEPAPDPAIFSREKDEALEGLRGCAALAVLYGHLTAPRPMLDPHYAPSPFFWRLEASIMAVMLFFILSGYVIGLTNRTAATGGRTWSYLARRAIRLLPIYFVAVLSGWLVRPAAPWTDLGGHFLFLQNETPDNPFHVALLQGNTNLWSLHYEVVCYLVFIPVWWLRPRLALTVLAFFGVGLLGAILPGFSLTAAWLACGLVLWLAGLAVAWKLPVSTGPETCPWPSAVLLAVATWQLKALHALLARGGFAITWLPGITFDYFDCLPVLLWLFLLTARRRPAWLVWLEGVAWAVPVSYIGWRLLRGTWNWHETVASGMALVLLAVALRGWQPGLGFFRRMAPIGAISYAVYAMGGPAQHLVLSLIPAWSGQWWTYALRLVVTVTLVLMVAWGLERKLQPLLRRRLFPSPVREP